MKRSNRSRAYALLTTASLLISSSSAVFPAVNAYAAEAPTKNITVTLSENWSNTIDFSGVDTENGDYKTLYDDATDSGNWVFDTEKESSRIISAIKAQTGDIVNFDDVSINDVTVNYSWNYASDDAEKGIEIQFSGFAGGMDSSNNWTDAAQDFMDAEKYGLTTDKRSGSAVIKASDIAKSVEKEIVKFYTVNFNMALWSNDQSDKVTLNIPSISIDLSYNCYPCIELTYGQLKNAKYLEVTYDASKKTECGHDASHIGDDGVSYYDSYTYCPWAGINVRRLNSNGVDYAPDNWYSVGTGADSSEITFIVDMADITSNVGALTSGDVLRFISDQSATVKNVTVFDSMPDIQLGKGKIDSMKIEESYDWDPELGSVPSGKPDIMPSIQIANNANEVSFKDLSAIKIDYTLGDPDAVSGIVVTLHGWEGNSVGWLPKYYAADGKSGSIIIDLSQYQDKTFHNIYVGPAAPTTAKIGDDFSPYFEITDAKILSSYSGSFTKEIPPIEIKDSAIEENRPSNPSQTVTPAQPDSKTNEEKVNDAVNDAKDNSDVKISVGKGDTKINAKIFIDAKNKGLTLEISLNNGVTWVISSDNITDDAASVDIDVKLKTKYIPKKDVEAIANGNDSMQVSLSHNGNFGFNADLKIPVSKKYEGMTANLFHYKNGKMVPIASSIVQNSYADLPFSHASEYVIVFSEEPMIEDIASAEGAYAENGTAFDAAESSAPTAVIFTAVFTVLAAAGFIAVRKIRQK